MIDLHCHLIPGVDDGPETLEDSVALARASVEAGIRTAVATPHLDHRWEVPPEEIEPGVARVRGALADAGIELEVLCGAEIALPRFGELSPAQLDMVRLGGGPYLLIESPHTPAAGDFHTFLRVLRKRGHAVLLAHPERCPTLQRRPDRVAELVAAGVLCSVTSGALGGRFGGPVREFALELLERGLVHNVASDSHSAGLRGPDLLDGLAAADAELPGILDQADWFTRAVPEAILAGRDLPPQPVPPQRRGGLRRLFARVRG